MNPFRNDIRICEDACADDPTHHDHRGVKEPEAAGQCVVVFVGYLGLTHHASSFARLINQSFCVISWIDLWRRKRQIHEITRKACRAPMRRGFTLSRVDWQLPAFGSLKCL